MPKLYELKIRRKKVKKKSLKLEIQKLPEVEYDREILTGQFTWT